MLRMQTRFIITVLITFTTGSILCARALAMNNIPISSYSYGILQEGLVSPSGSSFVTVSCDGMIRLWDRHSGKVIKTFGRYAFTFPPVYSPDGSKLLLQTDQQAADIWDASTGDLVRTIRIESSTMVSILLTSSARKVIVTCRDRTLRVIDEMNRVSITTLDTVVTTLAALSPDESRMVCFWQGKNATIRDVATGKSLRTFMCGTGENYFLAAKYTADGKKILLTTPRSAEIRHAETARLISSIERKAGMGILAISPEGARALIACDSVPVSLWNITPEERIRTISDQSMLFSSAQFINEDTIFAFCHDGVIRTLLTENGSVIRSYTGHSNFIKSISFSPDGRTFLTGSYRSTYVWSIAKESPETTFTVTSMQSYPGFTEAVAFSPEGSMMFTGAPKPVIRDAQTRTELVELCGKFLSPNSARFSSDGSLIITGHYDGTARVWETETGKQIHSFAGHEASVCGVAISPDSRVALTAVGIQLPRGDNIIVRLWDIANGRLLKTFRRDTLIMTKFAFSPDCKKVFTGDSKGNTTAWDLISGERQQVFQSQSNLVGAISVSGDGNRIATGHQDGTIRIWNALTANLLRKYSRENCDVASVCFTPDGSKLLSAYTDGHLDLWDVPYATSSRISLSAPNLQALTVSTQNNHIQFHNLPRSGSHGIPLSLHTLSGKTVFQKILPVAANQDFLEISAPPLAAGKYCFRFGDSADLRVGVISIAKP